MGQKNVKLASMEGNLQKLQENILEKEAIIESLINKRQIY